MVTVLIPYIAHLFGGPWWLLWLGDVLFAAYIGAVWLVWKYF